MVPSNFVGLVLLVTLLAPGFVWLSVSERRTIRAQRSPVLEVGGLVVVGAAASGVGIVFAVIVGETVGGPFFDFGGWLDAQDTADYLRQNLTEAAVSATVAMATGLAIAWLAAHITYRGRPAQIYPHATVWSDVFGRARGPRQAFLGVHLKDGTILEGYLHSYPTDATGPDVELSLKAPVFLRGSPSEERIRIRNLDHLVITGGQISHVGVVFVESLDNAHTRPSPSTAES